MDEAFKEAELEISEARGRTQAMADVAADNGRCRLEAEQKLREAEAEALRTVANTEWRAVQSATEYEERIRELEAFVESERAARVAELQKRDDLVAEIRRECDDLVRSAELRCNAQVAEAQARAKDAEDRAQAAEQRAKAEIAAARAREHERVHQARQAAEQQIKEATDRARQEVAALSSQVIARQRAMEETLFTNSRQKSESLAEWQQRIATNESRSRELEALREVEFARKEARLEEWTATQRRQTQAKAAEYQGLLQLEKGLHQRTMERTMDRITRQLQCGDAHRSGRETPTREVLWNHLMAKPDKAAATRIGADGAPASATGSLSATQGTSPLAGTGAVMMSARGVVVPSTA